MMDSGLQERLILLWIFARSRQIFNEKPEEHVEWLKSGWSVNTKDIKNQAQRKWIKHKIADRVEGILHEIEMMAPLEERRERNVSITFKKNS